MWRQTWFSDDFINMKLKRTFLTFSPLFYTLSRFVRRVHCPNDSRPNLNFITQLHITCFSSTSMQDRLTDGYMISIMLHGGICILDFCIRSTRKISCNFLNPFKSLWIFRIFENFLQWLIGNFLNAVPLSIWSSNFLNFTSNGSGAEIERNI